MYLTLLNLLCLSISLISGQITYPDMCQSRCGRITEVGLYIINPLKTSPEYTRAGVYEKCLLWPNQILFNGFNYFMQEASSSCISSSMLTKSDLSYQTWLVISDLHLGNYFSDSPVQNHEVLKKRWMNHAECYDRNGLTCFGKVRICQLVLQRWLSHGLHLLNLSGKEGEESLPRATGRVYIIP